ncbi:hypothetical protein ACIBEA_13985 [Streptomyces sp. NPDC051555]|uniref:hypothetical protein n=1 Tax=Streptomyces sp. NPDC051555 TaxID=3365657 RepID=UPI0037B43005
MPLSPTTAMLLTLALLAAVLLALLAAVGAGLLTRIDGASTPTALLRAGVAFGSTLTLITAVLAVGISVLR